MEHMKLTAKFYFYQSKDQDHLWEISVSAFTFIDILTYLQLFSQLTSTYFFILAECTGNVRLQFGRRKEGDLVQLKKLSIKIKVVKGRMKLHNLFNGDKVLGMRIWIFSWNIACECIFSSR